MEVLQYRYDFAQTIESTKVVIKLMPHGVEHAV